MSDIYAALAAVMADCDHVAKRDRNEHQRFMFRGIDAVVNAVGPVLRKHSVMVVPNVESVTYDTVQTSTGKPATACRILATYSFYASDGSSLDTRVAAEAWDAGDKAAPKAMSVAFRTALLQALALPTDEPDPDSQTYERDNAPRQAAPPPPRQQQRPPSAEVVEGGNGITKAQLGKIGALMGEIGVKERDDRLAYVADVIGKPVASSKELTKAEASRVIEALAAEADAGVKA
jgi:hypothetical protein